MKRRLLFCLTWFLLATVLSFGKTKYTYSINLVSSPAIATGDVNKYVAFPGGDYVYEAFIPDYNGFSLGSCNISLTNGKFEDGTSTKSIIAGLQFKVRWNDLANVSAKIKINSATPNDTSSVEFQKGVAELNYKIASLKGQVPNVGSIGSNPPTGTSQQVTAQVLTDMVYPGIADTTFGYIVTPRKVKYYQWTLPANWQTVGNPVRTGTFITDANVKQIVVQSDYVTAGSITVRGVNDVNTSYSELASLNFDRGFSFTAYPSSITYGDNTAQNFAVTNVSGLTYEWSVPAGWQINGQGNLLEGLNLSSVNITPSFCSSDSKVLVRLKNGTDVSAWYVCPYQGITQPAVMTSTFSSYQYEGVDFSVFDVSTSAISSILWSGDGVSVISSQGASSKICFTKSGTIALTVTILMSGCSTPIVLSISVVVKPSRISLSGPSQVCDQATYTIDNLPAGATVVWSATPSGVVSYPTSGSSVTLTKVGNGLITLSALINNSFTITKDIWVGVPSTPLSIGGFASNGLKFASVSEYSFYVQPADVEGVNQYTWAIKPGSGTIIDGQGTSMISVETADIANSMSFYVSVKVANSCGWSSTFMRTGTVNGGGGSLAPKLRDTLEENAQAVEETKDDNASYNVLVYDQLGRVLLRTTQKGTDFSTSTSNMPNGTYIVKLYNEKTSLQKKLIIRH